MILLIDENPEMVEAWKEAFPRDVPVVLGDILEARADALVAPGNSSGSMTGGLDLAIARKWPGIESLVRDLAIMEVGSLNIVTFPSEIATNFKYLLYVPTMRGAGDVSWTTNAYTAMRAVMSMAAAFGTIAIPGLCTGVGKMKVKTAATQMAKAYKDSLE